MAREDTINLAIYEAAPDEAEYIATELRNCGHAIKPFAYTDKAELQEILSENRIDLILASSGPQDLDAAIRLAEDPDYQVPVIALAADTDNATLIKVLQTGGRDLVSRNQPDHLRLVIERELGGLRQANDARFYKEAYTESEKRCRSLLDSSRDAIAYIHDGMHIYANSVYVEMFGFEDADDLEGLPILDMVTETELERFKEFLTRQAHDDRDIEDTVDIRCVRDDGSEFDANMEFSNASIDGEACTQVIIRKQEIDESVIEELEQLKTRDTVTGLGNRQTFIEKLEETVANAGNGKMPAIIMYIEIDNFESFQHTLGIANIDKAFGSIGKTINETIDDHDLAARFGEHSFTILTHESDKTKIAAKSKRIIKALDHVVDAGSKSTQMTASMGLVAAQPGSNIYELLARAESACVMARENGGNTIQAYKDPEKEAERKASEEELRWVNKLNEALENDRFSLAFQPIVGLVEGSDEIYETLLRLTDEEGNEIAPKDFIPPAERSGIISKIDRWVIAGAMQTLRENKKEHDRTCLLMKLSTSAFSDESLLPWLYERTKETGIETSRLLFEVPEEDAVSHVNQVANFSRTLQKMRCRIVLSQFGKSSDPFRLLNTLPVDFIKVSAELTGQIGSDPSMMDKLIDMVQKIHDLNKPAIAPHVEDAESMAVMFQCGFNYIQGNFLQEPDIVMQFDFGENEASMHTSQAAMS